MPECKKFIQNYVDKVIIFKDHVEVIFNVVFTILKDYEAYKIKSSANKTTLLRRYKNIA
ncbi:hypothetical protein [Clostridium estertheticum]|uniref:hypothetical protein n=1 Tax=Clostridium estertheticum TaxID=238834 RepID=UPI001CF46CA8|nr:hypothetical protein [Clostridium estertheticum]MCB2354714.1 hypothetical protein [Clostridium estertheticum]WAG40956.1 hypothetical protein LL065_22375 [Clostridium estertheticum]